MLFLCMIGGVYVTTMFAVMPKKDDHSYGVLFGLLWKYFSDNDLNTDWTGHYVMMDFETTMRQSLLLFFPSAVLLGCYFHWSQVNKQIL